MRHLLSFIAMLTVLGLLAASAQAAAPARTEHGGTGCVSDSATDFADLPTAATGKICTINDGLTGTDCTTGGGSTAVVCWYDGAAWTAISGSAATTLAALTDTVVSTPAGGHLLIYDGVDSWDNKIISGDITIDSAGDVNVVDVTCSGSCISDSEVDTNLTIDHSSTGTYTMDTTDPTTSTGVLAYDATVGAEHILIGAAAGVVTFYQHAVAEQAGASLLYNGADTAYDLVNTPASCDQVDVQFNGHTLKKVAATPADDEFTCATATLTLGLAPASGDHVQASYPF